MANATPTQPYVLVLGAAGVDSKGRAAEPLTLGSSTPGEVRVSVGGTARNVADNLARLGIETILMSAIGHDGSGKRIVDSARDVGLNIDYMIYSEEHHTAAYLAVLDETGNRVVSVDDMAILSCLTPQIIHQRRGLVKNAEIVIMDSNLSGRAIASLFKVTNRYQVPVCADPASTTLSKKLLPYLSDIYMITPNVAEAELLSGQAINNESEAITAARKLVNGGVNVAIITLAEEGMVYASPHNSGHVPALMTEVVDSTGASDALTATVVFALLNEIPLDEAVRLSATAAALTLASSDSVCADLSLDLLYDRLLI